MSTTKVTAGQKEKHRVIEEIIKSHGHIPEADYGTMQPEVAGRVRNYVSVKDENENAMMKTLIEKLYSKDVRFIFELLQNADDNCFSRAVSSKTVPYVSFHLYENRLVVECNEDGFTEENVRAICNFNKSTKKGNQHHIGEKGMGFKSVFNVAWKVEIQSGDWSFSFQHRKGDPFRSTYVPEWFWPTQRLVPTRMTLFLHDSDDEDNRDARRQDIWRQLKELHPAMLLFLRRLRQIEIHVYDRDGTETFSSTLEFHRCKGDHLRVLKRICIENGHTKRAERKYHTVELTARNLPRNENREYSDQEERSMTYSTAPIVLAFPLSKDEVPIVEPQEVFAFLPTRRVGFNFLIHSDFVTQASREDIMANSPRNLHLLDALADSFLIGVKQLCQHPTLKYQWMRYLPKLEGYHWDPFWEKLVHKIKERISRERILFLRCSPDSEQIANARRLTTDQCDQHNEPLFDDFSANDESYPDPQLDYYTPGGYACYLSPKYQEIDLNILRDYGLRYMEPQWFLFRVCRDLEWTDGKASKSRMRTITDDEWHIRAARCLKISLDKCGDKRGWTSQMNLVPLTNGNWVSSPYTTVYFATTSSNHRIPSDLGYRLIDPAATRLRERKQLFTYLGAQYLPEEEIVKKIYLKYTQTNFNNMNLEESSLSHVKFLYLTHNEERQRSNLEYLFLSLYGTDRKLYPLKGHTFYFKGTTTYSFYSVLNKAEKFPQWPDIHFINEKYEDIEKNESIIARPSQHNMKWKDWLKYLGVREYPRLFASDLESISEECLFVAKHIPSELLSLLRLSWANHGKPVGPELVNKLKDLKAPCEGDQMQALSQAYLPVPTLLAKRDEFLRYGEIFPFLDIGDLDQIAQWDFLKGLGVRTDIDLNFYLEILYCIALNDKPTDPSRIPRLYSRIHSECVGSNSATQGSTRAQIRDFFELDRYLFLPSYENKKIDWVLPSECLLDAPIEMKTKIPILPRYRAAFSDIDLRILTKFFHGTLGIPKCSWSHMVDELKHLKAKEDCQAIPAIYRELMVWAKNADTAKHLQGAFENDKDGLLFADQMWYTPSQCFWSAASAPIHGRVNLSNVYGPEFETFFVKTLGVRRLDANLVYSELLELEAVEANVEHVKDLIKSLNSLLEVEPPDFSKLPILPLRLEGKSLTRLFGREFAIPDRKKLYSIFHDKIALLDFTVQEVCQLRPFIKWANLEDRYLSRLVKESSSLDSRNKSPISDPSQDVKVKALGLCRVGAHFNSPRTQDDPLQLYELLCNSSTWEVPKIQSTLTISIGRFTVQKEIDEGEVHINDTSGLLEIYVPQNEELRYISYRSVLPKQLTHWMMTDPATNTPADVDSMVVNLVQTVLNTRLSAVNQYLDSEGIFDVAVPESRQDPRVNLVSSMLASNTNSESGTPAINSTSGSSLDTYSTKDHSPSLQEHTSSVIYQTSIARSQQIEDHEYSALLQQVVYAARTSRLLSLSNPSNTLETHSTPNVKTFYENDLFGRADELERRKRVGAAGELFVFELLSTLNPSLPRFTGENWTSRIRHYARHHPDYTDMDSWMGYEKSDLEYEDQDGILTEALIHKGLLQDIWKGRSPKFYIEVKTAPGHVNTPFYMSPDQYKNMQRLSTDKSICVIFRVFNLYNSQIGCEIYVNPIQLEKDGRLVFTAERWMVQPR